MNETAEELMVWHGLPEDIVDGVLALHRQEIAEMLRREHDTMRPYAHMGLPCRPEYECGAARLISLVWPGEKEL